MKTKQIELELNGKEVIKFLSKYAKSVQSEKIDTFKYAVRLESENGKELKVLKISIISTGPYGDGLILPKVGIGI